MIDHLLSRNQKISPLLTGIFVAAQIIFVIHSCHQNGDSWRIEATRGKSRLARSSGPAIARWISREAGDHVTVHWRRESVRATSNPSDQESPKKLTFEVRGFSDSLSFYPRGNGNVGQRPQPAEDERETAERRELVPFQKVSGHEASLLLRIKQANAH